MAQLKNSVILGDARVTDTLYAETVAGETTKLTKIQALTASNGATYGPGTSGQVLKSNGTSVYWASDSDADTKVTQAAAITTAGAYPVLLGYSTATTAVTNTVNKTSTLTYNPNTKAFASGGTINGYTLAAACAKSVDTSISAASTSANLPTSAAVASFVEGKGYTTTAGTVTSVRVQATSPVTSSTSTAQSTSLNTTIALADGYGDTKNPYAAKAKNLVLAGPSSGNNAAPTFRALVAADLPDHTHTLSLAEDTGTNELTLEHGGKYKLTAGGDSFVFTLPTDANSHYTTHLYVNATSGGATSNAATANTTTYLHLYDNSTKRHTVQLKGAGGTTVAADANGVITITGATNTDTKVTSVGNHYTPSGGTAIYSTDEVAPQGGIIYAENVSIKTDAAGHVTDIGQLSGTLKSEAAAANGTTLSLVTTGEKATWNAKTSNAGTVTSVRVQATSPVTSSTNTAQSTSLNTTIALADGYGDTKNPYAAKAKNLVLAGPSTGSNAVPTFRALVAADLPAASTSAAGIIQIGSGATNAAAGNHTHTTSLAADTGTSAITLAHGGKYKLTAGGGSVIFTMPTGGGGAGGNAKIFEGTCDTAAATTAKVVTCADFTSSDLVIGAKIYVTFDETNSGAVANITLNVNGTGAKNIKKIYNAAVSNLTAAGELRANETVLFTYDGTYWVAHGLDYNNTYTTSNNMLGASGANYVAHSVLYRYQLVFGVDDDKFTPLNNVSNGASNTSKAILTSVEFDPFGKICYYNSTTGVSANAAIRGDYLYYTFTSLNMGYSLNITASVNPLTAAKDVYLKVSPQSSGKVTLASATPIVQALPTSNDGYWYIYLGRAVSTTNISLQKDHPVYYHNGTEVCEMLKSDIRPVITVVKSGVSALPTTITHTAIKDHMVVLHETLSNPHAQVNNWTVTTANGSATISGSIHGTTDITLVLG